MTMVTEAPTASARLQGLRRAISSLIYPLVPVPANFRAFGYEIDIDFGAWVENAWSPRQWDWHHECYLDVGSTHGFFVGPFAVLVSRT